jgi:Flp pilus assembly protein TadD
MPAHLPRAIVLFHQHRPDLAEEELRLALTEEPHNAQAYSLLALCLQRHEAFKEAISRTVRSAEIVK